MAPRWGLPAGADALEIRAATPTRVGKPIQTFAPPPEASGLYDLGSPVLACVVTAGPVRPTLPANSARTFEPHTQAQRVSS
jgi:hypothetical protein